MFFVHVFNIKNGFEKFRADLILQTANFKNIRTDYYISRKRPKSAKSAKIIRSKINPLLKEIRNSARSESSLPFECEVKLMSIQNVSFLYLKKTCASTRVTHQGEVPR